MRRICGLLIVAGLPATGCAQILGLDTTSAGSGSSTTGEASLEVEHVSIGATVVRAPQDITGLTASFLLPDRATATQSATDTWSADIEGTPPIEFQLPDMVPRIYALGAHHQLAEFDVLEHPTPAAAPAGATFAIDVTLDTPYTADALQMYTVGAWSQRTFTGSELPVVSAANFVVGSVPYASYEPLAASLQQITSSDAVLVLESSGGTLVGALDVPAFDQTAGPNPISGTLTTVAPANIAQGSLDGAAVAARFTSVMPAVSGLQLNWQITDAPGTSAASVTGPTLASGGFDATTTMLTAMYGNPFTSRPWTPVLTVNASASRTFTPLGTSSLVVLSAGITQSIAASTGLTFDLAVGVPTAITVGGVALTTDGMSPTIDTAQPVVVAFTPDQAANTFYELKLLELDAGTATTKLIAFMAEPTLTIPTGYFASGHTYVIRALSIAGSAPMAADGNLQARELPLATAFADSAVFTVP